jgi:PAS domain S-box-containing protein
MNSRFTPIIRTLLQVCILVALYYLVAQAGYILTLPPVSAISFWPPAGLALTAMLLMGWPAGIGIFIGAILGSLAAPGEPSALPVAAVTAAAADLQAGIAAWLFKRFLKDLPPKTAPETIRALAVAALASVVSPLISTIFIHAGTQPTLGEYAASIWGGWVGNFTGILILTPAILILSLRFWRKQQVAEPLLWPITSLVLGITIFAFFTIQNSQSQQVAEKLRRDTVEISNIIHETIKNQDIQAIHSLQSFFTASEHVSQKEFSQFIKPLLSHYSYNSSFSWVPLIPESEKQSFEQEVQAQGQKNYFIYEKDASGQKIPAAARDEYFPVVYIEPFATNQAIIGFDNGSSPQRIEALQDARDSGEIAITGPIQLVQDTKAEIGILIVAPVYKSGAPIDTVEDRRANFTGAVTGAFKAQQSLENALNEINRHDIEIYLFDAHDPSDVQFLAFSPSISGAQSLPAGSNPALAALETSLSQIVEINIGNRTWLVLTRPGPEYESGGNWWISWASLLTGLLLTGIFLVYVSRRQQVEAALMRSEAEFRAISEYALTGIVQIDVQTGKIAYANPAMAQIFECDSVAELVGMEIQPRLVDSLTFAEISQPLAKSSQVINQEIDIVTFNGGKRHLLYSASRYKGMVSATLIDITERIRAGREIAQLSRVVSQMADTVVITDINGLIEYVNPAFEHLTGYTQAEALGKTPRILKSNRHSYDFYENLWETILRGEVFQSELVNRKKNGDFYYETKTITPIRDAEGKITQFVATGKDITERKLIEEALHKKEAEYRLIADNTGDAIWILDLQSQHFTYVSPSVFKLRGYTQEEVMHQSMSDVLTPESFNHITTVLPERIRKFNQSHEQITYSDTLDQYHKNGSIVHTEISTTFVLNEAQKLQIVGISRDITERMEAQVELQKSKQKLDATLNALPDLLFELDENHRIVDFRAPNPELLYIPPADFIGKSIRETMPENAVNVITQALRAASISGRHFGNVYSLPTPGGDRWFELSVSTKLETGKEQPHYIVMVRDITERKTTEDALRKQKELLEYHYTLVEILTSISTSFINLPSHQINDEINKTLQQMGEFEEVDRSYIFLFDKERVLMTNTHEWCAPGIEPQIDNLQDVPTEIFPWWMTKMERGEEVYIPDVSQLPEEARAEREILEPQGIQSLLAVPFVSNNRLVGFVGFDSVVKLRTWDADSILIVKMMSDIISNALTRKTTEEALITIEKRNTALIQNAPDGIALLDKDGIFQFVSPSGYRIFEYGPVDIIGTNALDRVHPAEQARVIAKFRRLQRQPNKNFIMTYRFRHHNGDYRWVEATFTNLLEDASVKAIILNFRDVTERKLAAIQQETAYRIAEAAQGAESLNELYPRIHGHIGKVMYAANFYIALYDEASDTMEYAYSVDEMDPIETGPQPVGDGLTGQVLRTGKSLLYKRDLAGAPPIKLIGSPSRVWLGVPLMAHGKTIGAMAVQHYTDINAYTERDQHMLEFVSTQVATAIERKQNEEAVQRIERRNRALIENAPDGIVLLDQEGRFVFGSPSAINMFGYTPEEMLGTYSAAQLHPDDRHIAQIIDQTFKEHPNAILTHTYRARHKDGSYRWIEAHYTNLLSDPSVNALVVNFRDITEQKTAQESLRQSENRFSTIFHNSPVGVSITHASDNKLVDVNRAWLSSWGYEHDEVIGRTAIELGLWANPTERELFIEKLRTQSRVSDFETILCRKSGEQRNVALSAEIVNINGEDTILIQIFDMTERKQTAEMLRKSQASLENAQAITGLGSWELDPFNGKGLAWSKEMFNLFRLNPEKGAPPLQEFLKLLHPEDRQPLLDAQERAISTGELVSVEYRATFGQDETRYFRANVQAIKNEHGQLQHISGTVMDITKSRLMELAIQDRVKELTCLFNISRILENRQATIEMVCKQIVEAIAPTIKYTQQAAPLLFLDGVQYTTSAYHDHMEQKLRAQIIVNEQVRGQICVFYTEDLPFIVPEQQDMLSNIARMLGLWLEQREAEAAMHAAQRELLELNRDLEKRVEERTAEVRRNEATYRALFENSNDGIFLLKPTGEDRQANQKALDILGYTQEEYAELTRNDRNAVSAPEQHADADARFAAALRGEYVPLYERTFIGKNGKRVDVEINLSPVRDQSGKVILVQSVVRDITERKKAEEALRESRDKLSAANAALEKASRLKDEFLASMSHELRTPLTGILGLSEALQMQTYGQLSEKQLKALKNIESSGRHLLELINDILDLSKIEAGKLDMQIEPCSAGDICHASLQLIKGMANQKKQSVTFSMNPASITIHADARRMKQMLVNLLSNAVKFTSEGGSLGLEVLASPEEKFTRFTVWDKGIGIKPEEISKLFKPFVQLDSSLSRQYAGTGLGLSLVQRMAELHGGSIEVESTPGVGSRFSIMLPWIPDETIPAPAPIAPGTGSLKNTLVIEDNELDAEKAARTLKELGITNVIHPSIRGALEKAAFLSPSAILLDLHLPDGSGMELLARLKADERTRHIPVIIISVEERRSEALQLGASGYLVKPISQQDLRIELEKAAAFIKSTKPVMVIGPHASTPLVMIADDNEMILETVSDFLSIRGFRVVCTRSGFELLQRAPELHPDIMLVDIQMPGMDGMETMRRLRAHTDQMIAHTPIIAITALAMSGDREKCLEAGADEYISKPVSLLKLIELLNQILDSRK